MGCFGYDHAATAAGAFSGEALPARDRFAPVSPALQLDLRLQQGLEQEESELAARAAKPNALLQCYNTCPRSSVR